MDEQVSNFVAVTGASAETASFFLDSAGGDLSGAIDQYYASGGNAGGDAATAELPSPAPSTLAGAVDAGTGPVASGGTSVGGGAPAASAPKPRPANRGAAGNVRGFADIGGDEEEDDENEHNDYYAGGEKSGQLVRGAPKKEEGPGRIEQLFDAARRSGAVDGRSEDLHPQGEGSGSGGQGAFTGTARTLAGGNLGGAGPTQAAAAAGAGAAAGQPQGPLAHTITFYRNGVFAVDDGEPRSIDDPSNAEFLRSIERGECPAELEPPNRSVPVTVNLLRRDEEYTPPEKPRYVVFGGSARKLTDAPAAGGTSSGAADAPAAVQGEWEGVNESEPATSVQLRLADGTRMVARFNLTHTVGDIRRFIAASRPDMPTSYQLTTAFPPQPLTDNSATIADAGLANSVVVQKM